ncbi:MAG: LysR family transcriptional regulator [Acidimicrobiales bacterium]|jgi:DNA-binding transcriptional LysR family regulator|nr:LysR family transcriptional regulator [Acidimicrobiia bacterium]HIL47618.1 LysR family transcriptional regulator [Acidimicrobiia bacterium]
MADPRLPNLTVQQLEYLVAAAASPTRAAAARGLGVTPSALTQGLAELERRVGVPLFERQGRQTRLRPQATEVLAHARRVVAETRDLARWAETRRTGTAGTVRLGTIDAVAIHHRGATIRHHRRVSPGLDLRLTVAPSGALLDSLRVGDLDLVVCVEPASPPDGIDTVLCLEEPLHAYAPDGAAGGDPETWGPWVTYPDGSHTRAVIAAGLRAVGAPFEVVAESNQPDVLREMVRLGMGWAVLPEAQAGAGMEPLARVRRLPIGVRRLVVARRSGASPDAAVDALAAALLDG